MRHNRTLRWEVVSRLIHSLEALINSYADVLHVAIDVSSDGQLQLPPYPQHPVSALYNITIFLSSYDTGLNFTVSNGTASAGNASLGQIMAMEPTSTVKHVNWVWPACLVGDGSPSGNSSRGLYNVWI